MRARVDGESEDRELYEGPVNVEHGDGWVIVARRRAA